MGAPLVTIGLAVYNGERFLRRALDSLLSQTYSNFELVISENASTDGTRAICQEYASRDPRVKLHPIDQNIGAVENFKRVLSLATGEYFMWAGDDDFWLPDFVKALVAAHEANRRVGVAMCAVDRVFPDGELADAARFEGLHNPNGRDHADLIRMLVSPIKLNLFIYGLFRTTLIRQITAVLPPLTAWDRWVMLMTAFSARFAYVELMLHRRTIYRHGRPPQLKEGLRAEIEVAPTLARVIWQADFIAPRQKALIPLMLARYARWRILPAFPKAAYRWASSKLRQ